MIIQVFMELATVESEEFPTIILEVIGISCRGFLFNLQKGFDTLQRLLGTLVEVGDEDITFVDVFSKQIVLQKDSTHETRCLKRVWV